jgi:hypothetical protein
LPVETAIHAAKVGASFGIAIEMLKDGHRVARKGWNGKGMFLRMVSGKQYDVACGIARDLELAPWIGMKTADGKFVPWLASQTDMLAEDWVIVEIAVKDQHTKIKGYRDLSAEEIALMNEGKELAQKVGEFVEKLERAEFAKTGDEVPDKRWLAIGKTDLQKGFMAVIRSIAKPTTF